MYYKVSKFLWRLDVIRPAITALSSVKTIQANAGVSTQTTLKLKALVSKATQTVLKV